MTEPDEMLLQEPSPGTLGGRLASVDAELDSLRRLVLSQEDVIRSLAAERQRLKAAVEVRTTQYRAVVEERDRLLAEKGIVHRESGAT